MKPPQKKEGAREAVYDKMLRQWCCSELRSARWALAPRLRRPQKLPVCPWVAQRGAYTACLSGSHKRCPHACNCHKRNLDSPPPPLPRIRAIIVVFVARACSAARHMIDLAAHRLTVSCESESNIASAVVGELFHSDAVHSQRVEHAECFNEGNRRAACAHHAR